jgi:hypothetical protein
MKCNTLFSAKVIVILAFVDKDLIKAKTLAGRHISPSKRF